MKEQILSAISADQTVVFPSEIVAQSWMDHLLLRGEANCLWSDQLLAWDTFQEQLLLDVSGSVAEGSVATVPLAARLTHRLLFAATLNYHDTLLAPLSAELSREVDNSPLVVSKVASLLPRLPQLLRHASFAPALLAALTELCNRYQRYLDAAGRYEPLHRLYGDAPAVPPQNRAAATTATICFPELVTDYAALFPATETVATDATADSDADATSVSPHTLPIPADYASVTRRRYAMISDEISDVARRIRQLLLDGVEPTDIALTVAGLHKLRNMIEPLFKRYQIPFHVHQSQSLIEYPFGVLLSLFSRAALYDFPHALLEELVAHPQLVWNAVAANELAIGVEVAAEGQGRRVKRLYHAFPFPLYRAVRSVIGSANFSELRVRLAQFVSRYLDIASWSNEQHHAYRYAFELLQQLVAEEERTALSPSDPFAFYLMLMQQSNYAPISYLSAVAIYNYPQSGGIYPQHHFLVNLIQDAVTLSRNPWSMFSDHFRHRYQLHDQQLTVPLLRLYSHSGAHVYCSYSDQHQRGGSQAPALLFLEPGLPDVVAAIPVARDAAPLPLEQRGARAYLLHRIRPSAGRFNREPIASAALRTQIEEQLLGADRTIPLSYRALADFIACPYRFYSDHLLRLTAHAPHYDDDLARRTGILQHCVMRALFAESQQRALALSDACEQIDSTPIIEAACAAEEWRFDRIERAAVFSVVALQCARAFSQLAEAYPAHFVAALEQQQRSALTEQRISLIGIIDLLLSETNATVTRAVLIDYKRKHPLKLPEGIPPELQLAFYSELLGLTGIAVVEGGYYFFSQAALQRTTLAAGDSELYTDLRQEIRLQCSELIRRLQAGDFSLDRSSGFCDDCQHRQLCRSTSIIQL